MAKKKKAVKAAKKAVKKVKRGEFKVVPNKTTFDVTFEGVLIKNCPTRDEAEQFIVDRKAGNA